MEYLLQKLKQWFYDPVLNSEAELRLSYGFGCGRAPSSHTTLSLQGLQYIFTRFLWLTRLEPSFSESAGFSIMWAWQPPEWHYAQFFSWFKELFICAFKWYVICFRILSERWLKLKNFTKLVNIYEGPCTTKCCGDYFEKNYSGIRYYY